jgi:AraC-like DNA-binding protein
MPAGNCFEIGRFVIEKITTRARCRRVLSEPHATLEVIVRGKHVEQIGGREYTLRDRCAIYRAPGVERIVARAARTSSLLVTIPPRTMTPGTAVAETTGRAWAVNLIDELAEREPGWQATTEGLILVGLGRLTRIAELAARRPAWLDAALELVREQQPLAVIAARVGRHPSHVAREFHRHEGVTVGEYARRCRLEVAAGALRQGKAISQVALDCGFCDQSHFTNAFRRVFGMTPGEHRKASRFT